MDKKAKILGLLPVVYKDEQKNQNMLSALLEMCDGNMVKLHRHIMRWPMLFNKDNFEKLHVRYARIYSDLRGHYPDKPDKVIFRDVVCSIFEQETKKRTRRNGTSLRIFMSMISRRSNLREPPCPKQKTTPPPNYGVQASLAL